MFPWQTSSTRFSKPFMEAAGIEPAQDSPGELVRSDIARPPLWGIAPGDAISPADYVSDALGWWFSGFVDGEGCFYIGTNKASFLIQVRDDDRALLERLRVELGGIGAIYRTKKDEGPRRPQCRLEVAKKKELLWLTRVFDFFPLQSKKQRDYLVWREAIIDWCCGSSASLGQYIEPLKRAREYRVMEAVNE